MEHHYEERNVFSRSYDAQEILSQKPGSIADWSVLVITFIVAVVIAAAWFIPYTEYITEAGVLTQSGGLKNVYGEAGALAGKPLASNGDTVRKGQPIACLDDGGVIPSPVDGIISFSQGFRDQLCSPKDSLIAFVAPINALRYVKVMIRQGDLGRIRVGQKVQLRFEAYPYQEFGIVDGSVSSISDISDGGDFTAIVYLSNGLRTSSNRLVEYRDGLRCTALIVIGTRRLVNHIFRPLA